jgi:SpoIID/LytB domain protein
MWLTAVAVVVITLVAGSLGTASVVAAAGSDRPTVVVNGRGWGHGRGMSQYGAQGYATDFGWSSAQILDHYYGGTTAGQAPSPGIVDPARVRVDLVAMRGRSTTVSLDSGTLHLMASDGSTLRRVTGAVRLTTSGGTMSVEVASSCDGPWSTDVSIDRSLVRIAAETTATDQSGLLQACGASYRTWYAGELWATSTGGSQRTINLVSIEDYLRGVVPNEMPASWDSAALEVQAVAARSYALAGDTRWSGYADTCDTTTCQVYDGRFTTRGSGLRSATHTRTDAAIAATAGLVRLTGSGAVARTEFSSSTGGYTAGGDFPAVVDEGDAVSINPNHEWQTTVELQGVEDEAGLGALRGISVSESNGLGVAGGRAITVTYVFENGTQSVDGNSFRRRFGLKSDWFSFGSFARGGVVLSDVDDASIDAYVDRAFQRLQGRAPTAEEKSQWRSDIRSGTRLTLSETLVRSDYFAGVLVDDLYVAALGRSADGDGRGYWVSTMADGLKYEHMGTLFYGSPEYVKRAGNTNDAFVTSLYLNILGRQPDDDGKAYWVGLLDASQAAPADVANAFYRSVESRRDRARALHLRVMDAEPSTAAVETYAERLLLIDDLAVAAELAASPEFTEGAG